jgi:hypothetical protein
VTYESEQSATNAIAEWNGVMYGERKLVCTRSRTPTRAVEKWFPVVDLNTGMLTFGDYFAFLDSTVDVKYYCFSYDYYPYYCVRSLKCSAADLSWRISLSQADRRQCTLEITECRGYACFFLLYCLCFGVVILLCYFYSIFNLFVFLILVKLL